MSDEREAEPTFEEMYPEDALRGKCHKCGGDIHKPPDPEKKCNIDHEGQAELAAKYYEEGDDPEAHRCRSCSAIYDGGMRCTYCGDIDPEDTGEFEENDIL